MKVIQSSAFFTQFGAYEVRTRTGQLAGVVSPVPVPGVAPKRALEPVTVWLGWAHDWDEMDNPGDEYKPLVVGTADDHETLLREIKRRVAEAGVEFEVGQRVVVLVSADRGDEVSGEVICVNPDDDRYQIRFEDEHVEWCSMSELRYSPST